MRALQVVSWGAPAEFREVPIPEVGPGGVLLRTEAVGLCESDLMLMDCPPGTLPYRLPFTLGHEIVGRVEALGAGTEGIEIGERALVYGAWGCGRCRSCAGGNGNACENAASRGAHGCGLGFDGGLAEFVVVPSPRYLIPIGDLDATIAAPLTDAALTAYHAIGPDLGRLNAASTAVVFGSAGLAPYAVDLLGIHTPARVVLVDLGDEPAAAVRAELSRSVDLVIDLLGTPESTVLASELLRVGGSVSVVGLGGGSASVGFGSIPLEASVRLPNWGTLPELHDIVAMARRGLLVGEVEVFPLDRALDAYAALRRGDIDGRAVVVPAAC